MQDKQLQEVPTGLGHCGYKRIMNTVSTMFFYLASALLVCFILYFVGTVVSFDGEVDWAMSISGGIASCIAEFITMPIETSKVRMQLNKGKVAIGLTGAFMMMVKKESFFAPWNGSTAALWRQFLYQSVKMMIYEPIKNGLTVTFGGQPDGTALLWQMVLAGGLAGILGAMITSPFDMAKVKAQADSSIDRTNSLMPNVITSVVRTNGLQALWTGWVPSCQRAFIVNAAELATYGYFKMLIISNLGYGDTLITHFLASCMAGFVASVTATPPDRIKIILMAAEPGTYSGVIDCIVKTIRAQGVSGLFLGFVANWARMAPWNLLFFVVLEQTYRILTVMFESTP